MPELAEFLSEIADRIEAGDATRRDARRLRKIAAQAAGTDTDWTIKVHARKGAPRHTPERRLAMAEAIRDYRLATGATIRAACEAMSGQFHVRPATLEKAWKEMRAILRTDEPARSVRLMLHEMARRQRGKK